MKEQENAQKLLEKFTNRNLPDGKDFSFRVYALEKKGNNYLGKIGKNDISYYLPEPEGSLYFVAEVAINLDPRGGWSLYQHFFQLDLASIKIELEKIKKMDSADIRFQPEGIANVLREHYAEATKWLVDYNGIKDNYSEIAALLCNQPGTAAAKRFGV